MSRGFWAGVAAYSLWGLFPIYFKLLAEVPPLQIIGHRIAWSFLVLVAVAPIVAGWQARAAGSGSVGFAIDGRTLRTYGTAALLIALNWFIYVWAVAGGFIVETSLGYFLTPLVNVLLGVAVLGERLRRMQWMAVTLATLGVAWLTWSYGGIPWIAIALAATFGTYGLVKKRAPFPPVMGLTVETGVLFLPAAAYLLAMHAQATGAFLRQGAVTSGLLLCAGVITTVPLLLFATAVQRVPLSVIGILQFIAPTIQFLLGVFVYGEPFSRTQLLGFAAVWMALGVFTLDIVLARVRPATPVLDEGEF